MLWKKMIIFLWFVGFWIVSGDKNSFTCSTCPFLCMKPWLYNITYIHLMKWPCDFDMYRRLWWLLLRKNGKGRLDWSCTFGTLSNMRKTTLFKTQASWTICKVRSNVLQITILSWISKEDIKTFTTFSLTFSVIYISYVSKFIREIIESIKQK